MNDPTASVDGELREISERLRFLPSTLNRWLHQDDAVGEPRD